MVCLLALVFAPGDFRMTGPLGGSVQWPEDKSCPYLREGRGEAWSTSCSATTCSTGTPRVADTRRSRSPGEGGLGGETGLDSERKGARKVEQRRAEVIRLTYLGFPGDLLGRRLGGGVQPGGGGVTQAG